MGQLGAMRELKAFARREGQLWTDVRLQTKFVLKALQKAKR